MMLHGSACHCPQADAKMRSLAIPQALPNTLHARRYMRGHCSDTQRALPGALAQRDTSLACTEDVISHKSGVDRDDGLHVQTL